MPIADGNDSYTVALLHLDTSTGDTNFGSTAHTWTTHGNAGIGASASALGGGALYLNTGATGGYVDTPDSTDWTMGSSDFTADFFFRRSATGSANYCWLLGQCNNQGAGASAGFLFAINTDNTIQFACYVGSSSYIAKSSGTITDTTIWHHAAGVRNGSNVKLFIDGIPTGACGSIGASAINDSVNLMTIGRLGEYPYGLFKGWVNEVRISKGIARWTATFTPTTVEYGHNFTGSLSDTTTLGDVIKNKPNTIKSDILSLGDVIKNKPSIIKTDILSLGSTLSKSPGPVKSDSISLSDVITKKPSLVRIDSIVLSDDLIKSLNLSRSDLMSLSDGLSKNIKISKADIVTLLDFFSYVLTPGGKQWTKSLSDDIYLSDIVEKSPHIFKSDALSILDQIIKYSGISKQDFIYLKDIFSTDWKGLPAAGVIFEFVHKKRIEQEGKPGGDFGFFHKGREGTIPKAFVYFVPGAFSDAFDPNSFWEGGNETTSTAKIDDFTFRHIKSKKG